jgi:hypothetical protein
VTGLETASLAFTPPAQLADVIKISKVHWFNYEVGTKQEKQFLIPGEVWMRYRWTVLSHGEKSRSCESHRVKKPLVSSDFSTCSTFACEEAQALGTDTPQVVPSLRHE